MSKASEARALRIGRLMGALEAARVALEVARGSSDSLPDADARLLRDAVDTLIGIEQRAWLAAGKP